MTRQRVGRVALAACALLAAATLGCGSGDPQVAPPHQVDGLDGGTIRIAEPDTVSVVAFVASWCAPCRRELPELERRHQDGDAGVRYLAIAVEEEPPATRKLIADTGVTFPVGVDPDGVTLAAYGFVGLPGTLVIGRDGTVAQRYRGAVDFGDLDRLLDRLTG